MANNSGGGKFLTGFMCFFVGFIVAIAAEFAVIAGCLYWLYTSDLTTIFDTIGIENEDDSSGETKYIYINTTEITTVSDLIEEIRTLAELGTDGLTLGDFENFPIVDSVIDTIYETIADILDVEEDYVRKRIDEDELKEQTLTEIVDFLVTGVKGFGLDVIINLVMDVEDENNSLLLSLIYGGEAVTVTYDGEPYVLYYDSFTYNETTATYTRSDGVTLDSDYEQYLFKSASDYKLYYMVSTNGTAYIVTRSSGEYSFATTDTQSSANTQTVSYSLTATSAVSGDPLVEYILGNNAKPSYTLSGAYYTVDNGDGTTTYVYLTDAKTIGDILDGGIDTLLYDLYLSDLLSDQTLIDMFDGISIGDLMEDENISSTLLDNIYLSDFLGDDSDELLAEIFDGKTIGDIINSDDVVSDLFGDLYLSELFGDGADQTMVDMFEGYTVADLLNGNFSIDDISLSIMDVDPESDIMAFIVYSITDIAAQTGTITVDGETVSYTYTATLHIFSDDGNGGETDTTYDAYVVTDTSGVISAVYYYDNDNGEYKEASAVTINKISAQTDRLMEVLPIGDIMDVEADSAIMAFIGYSVTNVTAQSDNITVNSVSVDYSYTATLHVFDANDNDTTYDAYVVTDGKVISAVYYVNDSGELTQASGVTIDEISAQTNRLMDVVPIGDIMSVDADNAIMSFIAYSVTNVTEQLDSSITVGGVTVGYSYTATLHIFSDDGNGGETDTTYDAYVVTDKSGAITAVYYVDGTTLKKAPGVTINEISDQTDRMMDVVPIGDIMSIDADSTIMAFIGYSVTNVTAETGNKTIGSTSVDYTYTATLHIFSDDGNGGETDTTYTAYVVTDGKAITAVYYVNDSGVLTKAGGVTINEISTQTDRMMEVVPIGDLVTFSSTTKLTQKISESTINGIGDVIDSLTIVDAMDGVSTTDSTVILYIAYGISGFDSTTVYDTCTIDSVTYNVYKATYHTYSDEKDTNKEPAYDYDGDTVYLLAKTVTLEDGSTKEEIVYMYASYNNGVCETEISATSINDVTDRIDGLMNDLTIGEIAGESLDTSNKLAYKLSNYTVNTINDFIDALTLDDVIENVTVPGGTNDSDSSTIMDYIVYGLTSVTVAQDQGNTASGYTLYTAVYNAYGDSTKDTAYEYDGDTVYLLVDSSLVIYGIYADQSCTTEISETLATPVNYVTARMDGLMSDLTIGELMNTSGSTFLSALSSSTINSLSTDVQNLAIQSLFYDNIYSEVEASAAEVTADNAKVDSYLRVVYESITSADGTYYYYTAATTDPVAAASLKATTDSNTIATHLAAGTLYWTDGTSGVIYQVVQYSNKYLFLNSSKEYVQISGSERGHIDSTDALSTYVKSYGIVYTYGEPDGTWYFMLYSNGVENIYTVDDIEDLTTNATYNIQHSTLSELYNAGILSSLTEGDLDKKVYVSVLTTAGVSTTDYLSVIQGSGDTAYISLGDLYLTDTIDVFVSSFGKE